MYIVIGGGFLGGYVIDELHNRTGETIVFTRRTAAEDGARPFARGVVCDVTDEGDLEKLSRLCGEERLTVFYFAAMHNVDYLFEHPAEGRKTNIDALIRFLEIFRDRIDRLLFASTDCVYGEQGDKLFAETDETKPVCEYGRQKLEAERLVTAAGYTALRFPFMIGPSLNEKPHFYDKIKQKLLNNEPIEMIDGMYRSVLSYRDASRLIVSLALHQGSLPPVINVCGDRGYGKYDMGLTIAKNIGADPSLVIPLTELEGRKFFKDRRASSALMDNALLKKILGVDRIVWEEDR
ncbi:MAG: NAD(P)-dependent oxidoreductase [Clostridia bacterium]|nr:NAD(P)-dependent oxidoreductase [Clostridia bacterium]